MKRKSFCFVKICNNIRFYSKVFIYFCRYNRYSILHKYDYSGCNKERINNVRQFVIGQKWTIWKY